MSTPPPNPKIYHITHVNNVASIVGCGCVWSDAEKLRQGLSNTNVGMSEIKRRRLALPVKCHPGTMVGEYVPFYFCPRSVMLYLLHRGNHSGLTYRDGQEPIVHLQADLEAVIRWAGLQRRRWAFTTTNAGARYTDHYNATADLALVDWDAVGARDFRDPVIKEHKQAEFLLYGYFPWNLVEAIGVCSEPLAQQVEIILADAVYRPQVRRRAEWYY